MKLLKESLRPGLRLAAVLRFPFALALVLLVGLPPARAGGDGGSGNPGGGQGKGDEVTTLPYVTPDADGSIMLFGHPEEVISLVLAARGTGTMSANRRANGELAVTFSGDWNLRMRRSTLESARVRIVTRVGGAFENGQARLSLASGKPLSFPLDQPMIEMPLGDLARAGVQGFGWNLIAQGSQGAAMRNVAYYRTDRVYLIQRTNR